MKILAIEFSSSQRSAALLESDSGAILGRASEVGGREVKALGLVQRTLDAAQATRETVECIVLGRGPGSYTGIRASISLAQGWQVARGTPLLGISTAEVLAGTAQQEGLSGMVNVIIDPQRAEFYVARYMISEKDVKEMEPLRLIPVADLQRLASAGGVFVGPEAGPAVTSGRTLFPDAGVLARLARSRRDFVPGNKLEPIYLRETAFVKAAPTRTIPE
jgi:tRNA threonylcarbamoyl adenosine modification protein YeaZ